MYSCTTCKYYTEGKKVTPGSFFIEVILWFMFIIPGFLYSLWRLSGRKVVCGRCGSPYIIKDKKWMGNYKIQ